MRSIKPLPHTFDGTAKDPAQILKEQNWRIAEWAVETTLGRLGMYVRFSLRNRVREYRQHREVAHHLRLIHGHEWKRYDTPCAYDEDETIEERVLSSAMKLELPEGVSKRGLTVKLEQIALRHTFDEAAVRIGG